MLFRLRRVAVALLVVLAMLVLQVAPAGARALPAPPNGLHSARGTNTQMTMSGTGPGRGVSGFIPDGTEPFDPVLDGYPASNPVTGFTPKDEGFAGVIFGQPTDGSATLSLYCFDLFTDTWPGIGYALGTWDAATVPNVGYVARILNEYYPFVPTQPAGLANTTEQAATVQAAIWFFSDRYVLNTSDPLHDTVAAIVAHIISEGPATAPPPPSLAITPTHASGASTSAIVGPFTVTSGTGSAAVTATGADMFSDAAGTAAIANGATVTTPAQIWLKSTGTTSAVLQATAKATVPHQNVYLYDGNTAGLGDAQRLILALDSELTTTVTANAEFKPVGSLVVQKTIAGPAAGSQGQVTIHTVCDGGALTPDFVVASGSPAGTSSRTYTGIPSGSVCTITETANGTERTTNVLVDVTGDGQQVTIPQNSTATAMVTDTYHFVPGSLTVVKTIAGSGAGQQGPVTIHVECPAGTPLTPDFVIPAGTPAGTTSMTYNDIPGNTVCTVTETADGSNSAVSVVVSPVSQTVTVPVGGTTEADVSNDYELKLGSLVVTKTIAAGAAAGLQGQIVMHVACSDGVSRPDFVIDAGAPAGSTTSPTYSDIPAGTVCTVTETSDGSTSTVAAEVSISDSPATIPGGGTATVGVSDTYTDISGQLVVNKTIAGDGAGHQGVVTIHVACTGVDPSLTPDFTIPAGGSSDSRTYPGLPPGTPCTVTETANGAITGVVDVTTDISPAQPVTISASGSVSVDVTDTYTLVTGSLVVTKTIAAGGAAGLQGQIVMHVACSDGVSRPDFVIDAGAPAGSTPSPTYSDIPAGTVCTVTETSDGSTSTVAAEVSISDSPATIPGGGTATVGVSDTYTDISGQLVVNKTIAGDGAGHQGVVTIHVACTGVDPSLTPDFTIPAGGSSDSRTYPGLPPGTPCTVTETANGAITGVVDVTTDISPAQPVTISASGSVSVDVTDTYTLVTGSLVVTKTIAAGGAAGLQGQIVMHVACSDGVSRPDFVIDAGAPAGSTTSPTYSDIPAGTVCTVTETSDGSTSTVAAEVSISDSPATIPGGGTATVGVSDTYTDISGQLVVNKTIAGDGAGHQGVVTIHVACTGVDPSLTPDFTIPAGGSSDSRTYPGLPPGTPCTVTETANGAITGVVDVTTDISPAQPVTISASGSVSVDVTDTYTVGSLVVNKTIAGPAAGQQGDVTIRVRCIGVPAAQTPDFEIPAGTPTGTTSSPEYAGIPGGTTCFVFEIASGRTSTVAVTVTGLAQKAEIVVGENTVTVTDTYTPRPGGIIVGKILAGPFAGQQGPITIHVSCPGVEPSLTPDFTIPAGTPAGLRLAFYNNIPAGSTCTVTETADGATSVVTTTVIGGDNRTVDLAAGTISPVLLADIFTDAPGTLVVTKTISGAAAGQQGPIAMLVDCGQPLNQYAFTISANTAAGTVSRSFPNLPAGLTCTVTETSSGASSAVAVTVTGSGQRVAIPAAGTATARLTDTITAEAPLAPITKVTVPVTG